MEDQGLIVNDKKTIRAWAFFDWANSAYALVISTAVFPPYFSAVAPDNINILGHSIPNSSVFSYSISIAFLIVAFLAPMLSSVADFHNKRKMFLKFFTILGSVSCASLYFFTGEETIYIGVLGFILATIGFGGGVVFYNSYLPIIATEDRYDNISAKGFAYGYIGSVILLIFILLMVQFPHWFGIEVEGMPARLGFLLVGIWWISFAQITFKTMPKDSKEKMESQMFRAGFREIKDIAKKVAKNANIKTFLASYFFYIGAVNTIIYLASIFAKEELAFETAEMIILILILQLVGIFGAYFFAWVSEKQSNKSSINMMLIIWMLVCLFAYFTEDKIMFYIIGGFVGLVMGGIQSLSRSSYSKLIDDHKEEITSYFSFYDVTTRIAIVSSTFIFGFVTSLTGNIRYSVLSLVVFFVVGIIFLNRVKFQD